MDSVPASSLRASLAGWLHRLGDRVAGARTAALVAAADPAAEQLVRDLAGAAARDELSMVYQPKLNARTGVIESAEGLLRWHHADLGPISPAEFIPWAERDDTIRDISEWVFRRALHDQARMAASGHDLVLSVNLSGRLVADRRFAEWSLDAARSAVGPIGLEITETAIIDEPAAALENLRAYADAGIRIAIDDYGAGLSSLAYLKQLPASELKIDKMFISGLGSSHRDPLLVRSTIDLAHALDMEVTAEGVESTMVLSLLRVMGCDLIQGFEVCRPLPLEEFCAFLTAHKQGAGRDLRAPVPGLLGPR